MIFKIMNSRDRAGEKEAIRRGGARRAFRRRGGAVIELALTLSILFSICYGTIEYGYYFFVKNTMQGAAREGCRAGIVAGATTSTCNTVIEAYMQTANLVPSGTTASGSGPYTIGNYTVNYYDDGSTQQNVASIPVGDTLEVQITATWGTVGNAFRPEALIGATKQVLAASSMRKEGQ